MISRQEHQDGLVIENHVGDIWMRLEAAESKIDVPVLYGFAYRR